MDSEIQPVFFSMLLWALFFIFICAVCIAGIRWALRKMQHLELYGTSREEIQKRWVEIEQLLSHGTETSHKLALLEADKLLDHTLKSAGFGGDTFRERLKLASYKYPTLRRVWFAHRLRNQLVHEATFHLSSQQATDAIRHFKRALKELGVL